MTGTEHLARLALIYLETEFVVSPLARGAEESRSDLYRRLSDTIERLERERRAASDAGQGWYERLIKSRILLVAEIREVLGEMP